MTTPPDMKTLVSNLYDVLASVDDSEIRKRAIISALTMLGDDAALPTPVAAAAAKGGGGADESGDVDLAVHAKAKTWMTRNKITADQLEHVFHIDGDSVEIIADKMPGKGGREQAINAYILVGIRELIKTGEAKFDDKTARDECERSGCHGKTNHATYMKSPGKVLSGNAKAGWSLTGPGTTVGADLVKQLTAE